MNASLPPLPSGVRLLKNPEMDWLLRLHPDIPSSPSNCPTCRGEKTFQWYVEDEVATYDCPCIDQWTLYLYLLYHGVPRHEQQLGLRDAKAANPESVEVVKEYIRTFSEYRRRGLGLFLWGANGTGKTMLGSIVLKEALGQGYRGFFTSFADLLSRRMIGFSDKDYTVWYTSQVKNAELLLLDDPGKEHRANVSFVDSVLDDLVRYRINMLLPTIITTNVSPQRVESIYGDSVASLLNETMNQHHVRGTDFRPTWYKISLDEKDRRLVRPICIS